MLLVQKPLAQIPSKKKDGYILERVREQNELGKENKVVTGKEPEQQIEDEQWKFIR